VQGAAVCGGHDEDVWSGTGHAVFEPAPVAFAFAVDGADKVFLGAVVFETAAFALPAAVLFGRDGGTVPFIERGSGWEVTAPWCRDLGGS
jgi:hypothetical protein